MTVSSKWHPPAAIPALADAGIKPQRRGKGTVHQSARQTITQGTANRAGQET